MMTPLEILVESHHRSGPMWFREYVTILNPSALGVTCWPSCCPSFRYRFFDAMFDVSWFDFPSQLASQSRSNSLLLTHVDAAVIAAAADSVS